MRARLLWSLTACLLTLATVVARGQSVAPKQPVPVTAASSARPAASAQTSSDILSYQGLPVREVRLAGVLSDAESKVWSQVAQAQGEALDRGKIRQTIKNLYNTGRYTDVAAEVERTSDGGVRLTFAFQPNFFIGAVDVIGAPDRPTASQIANTTKFQLGEQLTLDKITHGLERIRVLMEDNGFYHSSTAYSEQPDETTQQVDIRLQVMPGPPARVGKIILTGGDIKNALAEVEEDAHLRPGDRVTAQGIRDAIDRLRKKYRKGGRYTAQVSLVNREYHAESNTVDYTFRIERGPVVEISVEGAKISRSVLRARVPVYEENAVEDDLLNEGRLNLTDYMQARGYFDAKVRFAKKEDVGKKKLRIVYSVTSGARHKLVKLEVKGNRYFPADTLLTRMQVQVASRLFSHGRFSQSILNSDVKGLQELYRANGFQKAQLTAKVEDDYQGAQAEVAVVLDVEEGPQTLVGTSKFTGNRSISKEELRNQITSTEGQPYSEYNLASDRDQLLTEYVNRGYPDARLDISSKPGSEPNHMDVVIDVHEGEKVLVDKVLVSGLGTTRSEIVQREISIHPGDPLSQRELFATQQRLYDLGIFNRVDVGLQDPAGQESNKNVLIDVREAPRYSFNYGFGFEAQTGQPGNGAQGRTGVSPRVSFDVTRLNFRGRNHTIVFKSNLGALQQRVLLSYEAPRWMGNDKLRLSFTTFYDNTSKVSTFTSRRLEGAVQVEQKLNRVSTYLYRFSYRQVKADPLVDASQVPLLSRTARVGGPGVIYYRDKRDSPIEPLKGNNTSFDLSWASRFFASEADFTRLQIQNSTYHAIGKKGMVFARSTRIGFEQTFHNTILPVANPATPLSSSANIIPLPERLFAGGGNSHRGFSINQAGPRDFSSGQPLGGSALFLNSLELRLPPVNWPYVQNNLSFVLFNDLGNVFDTPRHLFEGMGRLHETGVADCRSTVIPPQGMPAKSPCDFNYLVAAVGTGVHYKTPIGPVRLDFGYNLNPAVFPVRQLPDKLHKTAVPHIETVRRFNIFFSIGQTF